MNRRSASETRENILAATRKVFAEHGYEQVSMRAIAQAAGVSVGGLYLYFRSKEELCRNLTEEWMTELHEETTAAIKDVPGPSEAVAAFINVSLRYALKHRGMILLQGKELGCTFDSELKKNFFRERRSMLTAIISRGIGTGQFEPCDPEEASKVIFSILRGFFVSMLFEEEALFLPETCEKLVLNGLARRTKG